MRPDKDQYFMEIVDVVAKRSTCARRAVGCVIVDGNYRIMSTGHNGVPPGIAHCTEHPCEGVKCPAGTGLDTCQATHAEINALLFCPDVMKIGTVYVSCVPCMQCVKALLTTSVKRIVYGKPYNPQHDGMVCQLLTERGIKLEPIVKELK